MNIRLTIITILTVCTALWAMPGTAHGQIYVTDQNGTVGKYNLDGTTVNASFITGLALNVDIAIALSGNNLYVVTSGPLTASGTVGVYDATTGAAINPSLVTGFNYPGALALSGNNLYVVSAQGSGFVGLYDATTGAAINPSLITGPLAYAAGIAISGNNLYVPSEENLAFGFINEYNATTGAPISVPLISGLLHTPVGLAVSGNVLYEANANGGTIGTYDATTGAVINASFITGLGFPYSLALLGNHLFVSDTGGGTVGEYDATTGAVINASLISGLNGPTGLVVVQPYSAQIQQPINLDGSSVFSMKRGVVPVKFTLSQGGNPTCTLPPATISVIRTAGGALGSIDESAYLSSADTGSNFRIDSTNCQYVYNLGVGSLGPGEYTVSISINGSVVGSATFGLK